MGPVVRDAEECRARIMEEEDRIESLKRWIAEMGEEKKGHLRDAAELLEVWTVIGDYYKKKQEEWLEVSDNWA